MRLRTGAEALKCLAGLTAQLPLSFFLDLMGSVTPGASRLDPPPIQTDSCLGFSDPGENPDLHHFLAGGLEAQAATEHRVPQRPELDRQL